MGKKYKALIVTGPTATGKTRLAVRLARHFDGEIISVDSRQVYRGLDLGTGKDLDEYGLAPDIVPHHLIDIVNPDEEFHLKRFLELAVAALDDVTTRGRMAIIVGGTPLYINALLHGYELPGGEPNPSLRASLEGLSREQLVERLRQVAPPDLFSRVDLTQDRRIIRAIEIAMSPESERLSIEPLDNPLVLAPFYPRSIIHQRIEQRLDVRLDLGLVQEVQHLHESGLSWEKLDWYGLEYRYVSKYLKNELSYDQMRQELLCKIRSFCKSQEIWFRKMEREGVDIHWLREGNLEKAIKLVQKWSQGEVLPEPELRLVNTLYGPRQLPFS